MLWWVLTSFWYKYFKLMYYIIWFPYSCDMICYYRCMVKSLVFDKENYYRYCYIHYYLWLIILLHLFDYTMSRTNKKGIAQKKVLLAKQAARNKWAKRFDYPKRKVSLEEAKERGFIGAVVNPKGNTYHWFQRWRKVCRETRMRIDPQGFRFVKLPGGGAQMVEVHLSGRGRKRLVKSIAGPKG